MMKPNLSIFPINVVFAHLDSLDEVIVQFYSLIQTIDINKDRRALPFRMRSCGRAMVSRSCPLSPADSSSITFYSTAAFKKKCGVSLGEPADLNNYIQQRQSNISSLIVFACVDEFSWPIKYMNIDQERLWEMSDVSCHSSLYAHHDFIRFTYS